MGDLSVDERRDRRMSPRRRSGPGPPGRRAPRGRAPRDAPQTPERDVDTTHQRRVYILFLTKEGERRKVADTPNNAHTHRGTHSARQNTHKTREERVRGS